MKTSTAFALLSTGAAQVLAAPFLEARQDSNEFIWENEDGVGNAQASIGDGLMSFGNIVPSTCLQQIDEHCTLTGCSPGEELSVPAVVVSSNYGNNVDIKMTVEGSFNAAGDRGSKAQLLDLAKKAMEELFNKGIATWEQDVKYLEDRCPGFQTNCNRKFSLGQSPSLLDVPRKKTCWLTLCSRWCQVRGSVEEHQPRQCPRQQ